MRSFAWSGIVCLVLVGCGKVTSTPDATTGDDAPDANVSQPDATPTACTGPGDCVDPDACTQDICGGTGFCEHPPVDPNGSSTFVFTGAAQTFQVPACVTAVVITALGAQGGIGGAGTGGGLGGSATATVAVVPEETLNVYVGGAGSTQTVTAIGGYNGGGGVVSCCGAGASGTGGGASDVRRGTDLSGRLIVAGGGGGGGTAPTVGGGGGGVAGVDGQDYDAQFQGGYGGTQSGGGLYGWQAANYPNESGIAGGGGRCWFDGAGCGAGGGGWYGGGGGGFAGGGGGSSYVDAAGNTNGSTTAATRAGNGEVTISW